MRTGDGARLTADKFRALLASPWYATLLALVPASALAYFSWRGETAWMIAAPVLAAGAILLLGHSWAAAQARREILQAFALARGLAMEEDPPVPDWTPLLGAGDERRMHLALTGAVDGMPLYLGHYTYTDVRHTTDAKGNSRTERDDHDFTVAVTDVSAALLQLPALYLKPDGGLFDFGDGWLSTGGMTRCETESFRFNERFKGWHRDDQDALVLRRFLDPSTVEALANHPLDLGIELCAGRLLVYIEGHCADSGELAGLVDVLALVRRCVLDAARVSAPAPASPGPPAA